MVLAGERQQKTLSQQEILDKGTQGTQSHTSGSYNNVGLFC